MLTFSAQSAPRYRARCVFAATLILAGAGSLAACKSLTSVDPSFDNVSDTLEFYPINGSLPGTPTAISLFAGTRQRADETFAYDIAFDIAPNGKIKLIPARALATGFSNPYSVGLKAFTGISFAELSDAPKTGYVADTTLAVGIGTVVAIESHDINRCAFAIKGSSYFSKLVVTGVDTTTRKISTVIEVNRNCGFHSFAEGKPKN